MILNKNCHCINLVTFGNNYIGLSFFFNADLVE